MNIKEKITEWQESFCYEHCFSKEDKEESNKELELVLFAIDTLTNKTVSGGGYMSASGGAGGDGLGCKVGKHEI